MSIEQQLKRGEVAERQVQAMLANERSLLIENTCLRSSLQNIMNWLEGSEGVEQIPPRYLTEANEALKQ